MWVSHAFTYEHFLESKLLFKCLPIVRLCLYVSYICVQFSQMKANRKKCNVWKRGIESEAGRGLIACTRHRGSVKCNFNNRSVKMGKIIKMNEKTSWEDSSIELRFIIFFIPLSVSPVAFLTCQNTLCPSFPRIGIIDSPLFSHTGCYFMYRNKLFEEFFFMPLTPFFIISNWIYSWFNHDFQRIPIWATRV